MQIMSTMMSQMTQAMQTFSNMNSQTPPVPLPKVRSTPAAMNSSQATAPVTMNSSQATAPVTMNSSQVTACQPAPLSLVITNLSTGVPIALVQQDAAALNSHTPGENIIPLHYGIPDDETNPRPTPTPRVRPVVCAPLRGISETVDEPTRQKILSHQYVDFRTLLDAHSNLNTPKPDSSGRMQLEICHVHERPQMYFVPPK